MAEVVAEVKPCSNPGCDQPGTKSCSACKTTFYCCVICQTADWTKHKEECDGHLRKLGKANLAKAKGFQREQNWVQALRYGELAATKLKQLKDRRLETVQLIDVALECKYYSLKMMGRHKEAMPFIEECYTLWAMNHIRNPASIKVAVQLIESCLNIGDFEDALRYSHHAIFMIDDMTDNFIPVDKRPPLLATASCLLAQSIFRMAEAGRIPPGEKQKAGEDAIASAHRALEIHTQLYGIESNEVANDMIAIADSMGHFNDVDDDEVIRLYRRAVSIFSRVEGSESVNVAVANNKLACAYQHRARRADELDHDLVRCIEHYELALPHYREAVRIYTLNNRTDPAALAQTLIVRAEGNVRMLRIVIAEAATASTATAAASTAKTTTKKPKKKNKG